MSFEVGEVDHEVIVGQMLSYDVVFLVLLILDGNAYFPKLIHQVNSKDGVEAVIVDCLPMLLRILARAAIGSAAFHDGTVYLFHEVAYQCRLQVVGIAALACRDFYADAALRLNAQRLVDLNE